MSKKRDGNHVIQKTNDAQEKKKLNWEKIAAIAGIVGALYAIKQYTLSQQNAMEERLNKSITRVEESVNKLQDDVYENGKQLEHLKTRIDDFFEINGFFSDQGIAIKSDGKLFSAIHTSTEEHDLTLRLGMPDVNATEVIAYGQDGTEYTAAELQNQMVVVAYEEDGQDVFFCGQYNEKYHWDGACVVNVYREGILSIATAAVYDDGERKSYSQVFADGDQWIYAVRETDGENNTGDTWKYPKTEDVTQKISEDDPNAMKMIVPEIMIAGIRELPLSRYHGVTADGHYNDITGDAFFISYTTEGMIKTMYQGRFKDGNFEDDTGDAWEIACDPDENIAYMYYRGTFSKGSETGKNRDAEKEPDLSIERILELIEDTPLAGEISARELIQFFPKNE